MPVWNGALTRKESLQLEKVQKEVLKILLKGPYESYTDACKSFKLEKLYKRRETLSLKFGLKELKKPNGIFHIAKQRSKRRCSKRAVDIPKSRTKRHSKSSIPYISRLINKNAPT